MSSENVCVCVCVCPQLNWTLSLKSKSGHLKLQLHKALLYPVTHSQIIDVTSICQRHTNSGHYESEKAPLFKKDEVWWITTAHIPAISSREKTMCETVEYSYLFAADSQYIVEGQISQSNLTNYYLLVTSRDFFYLIIFKILCLKCWHI